MSGAADKCSYALFGLWMQMPITINQAFVDMHFAGNLGFNRL